MSLFQHIKSFVTGLFLIAVAVVFFLIPRNAYDTIYIIISLIVLVYGLRLLWFYFTMARHMVGGKITLYQAIIVLDAALFTMTIAKMSDYIVLAYLLGVYAFAGVIDILRAFEAKKNDSPVWKKKIMIGFAESGFAILLVVVALILRDINFLVYGFAVSLASSGILRIYDAFRKTAVVYIQ
ncbi:MAG: DUF308 domain-containing protein [Ruminococcus sp.]|nr:DUF308 domain-containing protein [Ruminococcus sp.]